MRYTIKLKELGKGAPEVLSRLQHIQKDTSKIFAELEEFGDLEIRLTIKEKSIPYRPRTKTVWDAKERRVKRVPIDEI